MKKIAIFLSFALALLGKPLQAQESSPLNVEQEAQAQESPPQEEETQEVSCPEGETPDIVDKQDAATLKKEQERRKRVLQKVTFAIVSIAIVTIGLIASTANTGREAKS